VSIQVEHLTKSYQSSGAPVLADLSLEIEAGEIFGIIGANGAGKTTLMSCLLGLVRPDRGLILLGGRPPEDLAVRASTGYLPERLQFERWMTGHQFVSFHHALARRPRATRDREVEELLRRAGLDEGAWRMPLRRYSRGMLQRLGLAQALIGAPRFLLLDEPASGVDPPGVLAFCQVLVELRAQGVTVVLNSHQLDQIERVCDRVAYLESGQVRTIENLRQGEERPRVLYVRWLPGPTAPADLGALAASAGATLLEVEATHGRFTVTGDAQAAALLRGLVEAGVTVAEATPEGRRLERLFTGPDKALA
jgi:ABC-2 type transport system ATP-binding protein